MAMKMMFMKKEKQHGITRVYKMVIPAVQNLKQKRLISIQHLKPPPDSNGGGMVTQTKRKFLTKRKIIVLGQDLTGSARELNLIIAVCMACWQLKNAVMKPSW